MKVWIREILFASVVSTLEFTYQPVSEEGFISRLVDEVASSHSFDPVLSKDNVQTQSKQQLNPSRIYSQTETPLSTSNIEVEDFRRAGKSKRKFEGVFSTQIEGARAMNQNPWAQADFNWDFDNFGSTFYHLGRPSESDNSLVWNAQHQISPGRYKRLCSTNYPSSFLSEFEDLEDLGSFSKNSDYWNSFIEKLRPEATSELSDIHKNDEAGKILPVVPPLNPTSISNLETKIKKGIAFSEQNSPPDLGKLKSCNAPNHSSSDEENYIKKYLDKLFRKKKQNNLPIKNIISGVSQETNPIPDPKFKQGINQIEKKVDSQPFQNPETTIVLGLFGFQESKSQINKESSITDIQKNSLTDQGAILDIKSSTFKDEGISGNIKKHQEDPCAYGTNHLIGCLTEFKTLKAEENTFFGGKGNIMAVDGVTMTGLKSFLRGLRNYANIFLLPNISAINSNVLFKKYFEEQEYFRKKFDIPLSRFLRHDEKSFDTKLLDEMKGAIEKKENDGFKSSVTKFFFILEYMIKKNEENFLFIKEGQLSDFFSKSAPFFFKLKSNTKFLNPEIYASETLKVFDQLNWKTIFTADHNVEESETIKLILKSKLLPRWTGRYRMYIRGMLIIRNSFIVYSTLINKIFCEGTVDLKANFLKRQKEAIHFFDSIWSLFTTKKFGLMVIKDEDLPIKDYLKPDFLNSFVCKTTNNHFQIKINNSNKNRNETLWKIIHLWLFHSRYDLHNKLNHKNKRSYSNFKSFLQSFFICILKCYE